MFNDFFVQLLQDKNITAYKLSQDTGISNALISNWKTGRQLPKFDNIITLCDYLNISADYLLTGKEKGVILSDDENELITYYKKLPVKEQAKLISRAETIAEKYEEQLSERNIEYIQRDRYFDKVSAGTGIYLSNDNIKEPIDIEKTYETVRADYIVTVTGDSMEPLYHNNDMLMVKEQHNLEIGEIGIFVINDSGYVKKFGGDRLISLNSEYPDIQLNGNDSIWCQGKVIGVLDKQLIKGEKYDSTI